MEGPAMDWKMEEYPSDEDSDNMGWIWSKGVSLGKKVMVAGFVVSSAPLLVPSLVVASTIAMISSVPYCLFLASYACTEKLMSTLLPCHEPPLVPSRGEGIDGTGGIGKDESGFQEYGVEGKKIGNGEAVAGFDEAAPVMDMDEPSHLQFSSIFIQIEGEEKPLKDEGEKEIAFEVTNIVVDAYERPGVPEDEEMVRETKSLIEQIRDEDRTDEAHEKGIEEAHDKGTDEKPSKEDKKSIVSGDGRTEEGGAEVEDLPEKKEAPGIRHVDEKGETGRQNLDKHEGELEPKAAKSSTQKDKEMAPNEVVVYSEEQIWEKMDVMRRIVGYRRARSATCVDELKALYVFTGVEPPASIKDTDNFDAAQVSDRLRFLMSIIGIK